MQTHIDIILGYQWKALLKIGTYTHYADTHFGLFVKGTSKDQYIHLLCRHTFKAISERHFQKSVHTLIMQTYILGYLWKALPKIVTYTHYADTHLGLSMKAF